MTAVVYQYLNVHVTTSRYEVIVLLYVLITTETNDLISIIAKQYAHSNAIIMRVGNF